MKKNKDNKLDVTKLETLTVDNAKQAILIINKSNPEWGTKRFNYDSSEYKHHSWGTGSNSAILFESEFHFWAIVKKTYLAKDIDEINATENGTLMVFMKDGKEFETSTIDFKDNGQLDFSYID